MEIELNSVLGEKIFDGKRLNIYRKGVAYDDNYILWDNIDLVYIGGTKTSINFIPTVEDRTMTLVDETSSNQIYFSLSSAFHMGKEKKNLFSEIYSIVLNNVSQRQWTKFVEALQAGKRLYFQEFEMTREAIYFHKVFGGYKQINLSQVRGLAVGQGYLYIQYQDKNKIKNKRAGQIANIPNIHILRAFIDAITNKRG